MSHDQGNPSAPTGVGMTAIGVAYVRARETARPDRLFADPLAADFVAAAGLGSPQGSDFSEDLDSEWRPILASVITRTRFLDDLVLNACEEGCDQVVLLGAGLDARAFRLGWPPGVRLFELDTEDVLSFKERVLTSRAARPTCERQVVDADLRGDWPAALVAAGFRPEEPTVWVAEGLLVYFSAEENDRLLAEVSALSAAGSRFGITLRSQERVDRLRSHTAKGDDAVARTVTAMWRSGVQGDPTVWLGEKGWDAEAFDFAERAAAYGRPTSNAAESARPRSWLVDARWARPLSGSVNG